MTKESEEIILTDIMPVIEEVLHPIINIIMIAKSGKSKFKDEIKSVKNVLKMIASLLQAKVAAMDPKSGKG